jgi:nucleotidyltransferase substrate binding protein (TIGR01987 family)
MARDADLREQFRNSAIQCFEFTHELAFRMIKRRLEHLAADPSSVDSMAYMDVIRSGAEAGLVRDVSRFRDYREKRNITSHTYDARQAEKIVAVLGDFREDVRHLLAALEQRGANAD